MNDVGRWVIGRLGGWVGEKTYRGDFDVGEADQGEEEDAQAHAHNVLEDPGVRRGVPHCEPPEAHAQAEEGAGKVKKRNADVPSSVFNHLEKKGERRWVGGWVGREIQYSSLEWVGGGWVGLAYLEPRQSFGEEEAFEEGTDGNSGYSAPCRDAVQATDDSIQIDVEEKDEEARGGDDEPHCMPYTQIQRREFLLLLLLLLLSCADCHALLVHELSFPPPAHPLHSD